MKERESHAPKERKIKSSSVSKHRNRKKSRKAGETGDSDSNVQSGQEQYKEEIDAEVWYRREVTITESIITNDEWLSLALKKKEE